MTLDAGIPTDAEEEKFFCSACGGTRFLRTSPWHQPALICKPCFMVWYDSPADIDVTDPKAVGEMSLELKAAGKFPWTDEYASHD